MSQQCFLQDLFFKSVIDTVLAFVYFFCSLLEKQIKTYKFKEVWGKYGEESNIALMISKSHTLCVPAGIKYGCFHLRSEGRSDPHTHQ